MASALRASAKVPFPTINNNKFRAKMVGRESWEGDYSRRRDFQPTTSETRAIGVAHQADPTTARSPEAPVITTA